MKEEIKEILGTIKKCIETNDDNIESFIIDINKWKELLDYITNLQEKVNQYENPDDMTLMFMWCNEKAKDKIKHLQEENERLKDEKPEYILRWKLEEQIDDYKSRNEKAIEYIELYLKHNAFKNKNYELVDNLRLIRNILQGE